MEQKVEQMPINRNKRWSRIIGLGLALTPIHNLWMVNATMINGMATLFLPAFGAVLWVMATMLFLLNNWNGKDWGDKWTYVPLIVIVFSIGLSGMSSDSPTGKLAPLLMGLSLFAVYLAARKLGSYLFHVLVPFVILGTVISIVLEMITPGNLTGGLITNSCASAGFLIIGALTNQGKWQWLLCVVAFVGVLFIGALEGMFVLGVIVLAVIVRRDFNRWHVIIISILAGICAIGTATGHLTPIWSNTNNLSTLYNLISGNIPINTVTLDALTTGRWTINSNVIRDIQLLGHGYTLNVESTTAHNTPLIIVQQVGVPAAVAWTFVTLRCLIRTKWRYVWVAVLAMSVFDHYLWTQFAPYWWALVGVSLTSDVKSDLIFGQARGG